nr:hypothetical protein [Pleurocapsa sp. FMAR1]
MEISVMEGTSNQASSAEVGITNNSVRDIAAVHENSSQVSTSKINSDHTNFLEISSPQINIPQNNSLEVDSRVMSGRTVGINQLDSSKVTFPIVVPDQQVFSGDFPNHNSTPEIINVLNNSATNIWSDLLQSEASLDIDFQITDLPKGQLAEVTITGFDDSGKPNAGTILIDHDANGVG